MKQASTLPDRYRIGKTQFYQRRDYLIKLGYNMEPIKQGRNCFYSDEQIHWLDELNSHIKKHSTSEGFPAVVIEVNNVCDKANMNSEVSSPRSELVHATDEPVRIESTEPQEILVNTTPLEDIQEQNLRSVDEAAQYIAAQNLTALNYLTVGYMKERTFSISGLAEQVNQSEQVVRQSFTSLMESPEVVAKKLMSRVKPKPR